MENYFEVNTIKDSLLIGINSVNDVINEFEKEIQIQELEKIRNPYASFHCLDSSLFTVYDKIMQKDLK